MTISQRHGIVGTHQRRVDALGKVTGRAKFAEDYNTAHQLFGKVLRAKYPHAKLLHIDTSKAGRLSGDRLLREPQLCEAMRRAARQAARPDAAALIAERLINFTPFTHHALRITGHVDYPSLTTL